MVALALIVVLVLTVVFCTVMPGVIFVVAFAARAANWATVSLVGLHWVVSTSDCMGRVMDHSRVYDAHHAELAVHALRAIVPDRLGIINDDGEDGSGHARGALETGENAFDGGHDVVDWDTGISEG